MANYTYQDSRTELEQQYLNACKKYRTTAIWACISWWTFILAPFALIIQIVLIVRASKVNKLARQLGLQESAHTILAIVALFALAWLLSIIIAVQSKNTLMTAQYLPANQAILANY
ncbi:hypothetical protein [Ureaplasma ceti]|uniref:DUF4234 domain-containing protein n=1 Tax=Ureaplasma ceti TaxID=3119530 RepID=A0ABP9U8D4_9BACT